jgi:hypothetical protein
LTPYDDHVACLWGLGQYAFFDDKQWPEPQKLPRTSGAHVNSVVTICKGNREILAHVTFYESEGVVFQCDGSRSHPNACGSWILE